MDTHIFESVVWCHIDLDGDGIVLIDIAYWAANVVSVETSNKANVINGLDNTVEFLGQVSSVLSLVSTLRQMSDSDDGFMGFWKLRTRRI